MLCVFSLFLSSVKCALPSMGERNWRDAKALTPSFSVLFLALSLSASAEEGEKKASKDIRSVFASTEVKIQVEPGKDSFTAEWSYTNPHELPLMVEHVDSSCGCLAAEATEYKPVAKGSTGKITAQFRPENHRGTLRKSIHVRFVGYDKPVELVMEARIPSPVELSTQELIWTEEDGTKPQVIEVTSGTNQDFNITDLLGVSDDLFTIKQETVTEKRHYRLHITPTGEPAPSIQTLQVRTDCRDPRDRVIAVFLRSSNP